jgi:NAD(P)-dependent dehydrogenase (short-subunit alcohol dehydrogenase family)
LQQLGKLDVLCNIAGIGHFAWSHEETPEGFDDVVRVNLHGTFHVCRAALPSIIERRGVIINTASNAGLTGSAWSAAYCASKGGVVMLTKALAREVARKGVTVNAVAPGFVETAMTAKLSDDARAGFIDRTPIARPVTPDEVAAAITFLASDDAAAITGAVIPVDGGAAI